MGLLHEADRWLYRGGRPNAIARAVNRGWASIAACGWAPRRLARLEVIGRSSGAAITFPVVIADYEGGTFLVSMLGEKAQWVMNVRAASGRAVLKQGSSRDIVLEEVPPVERTPILRRYLDLAPGARAHIAIDRAAPDSEFARVAPTYPVFRITAA